MSSGNVNIRLATVSDQEALNRVKRNASLAVAKGEIASLLLSVPVYLRVAPKLIEQKQVWCAELADALCGFASFRIRSNTAEIEDLFVEPEFWRRGIGISLCTSLLNEALTRQIYDIRVVADATALPFYTVAGFKVIGHEETALGPIASVMRKKIR